jgi:predicted Rdx family selenoprotein
VKRLTKEDAAAKRQLFAEDAKAAVVLLGSPGGAALIRYLEVLWSRRGLGDTPEKTAYRVALRDALEQLKDIQTEGENAR